MPIDASPSGTLDVENATLRSRNIVSLTNMVAGNDVVRSSAAPTLEVYGDPSHGGNEPSLELVSNTANTISTSFTRLTSNAGVLDIQSGTDASDNGTITFGGFSNERMRIATNGNVGIGVTDPASGLHVRNPGGADVASSIIIQPASTQFARGHAKIEAYPDATFGAGTGLRFYTREDSGNNFDPTSLVTTRMTIRNNGTVGINTTNPAHMLQVGGYVSLGDTSQYLFRPAFYYYQSYTGVSGYARHYMEVNNAWTLEVQGHDKMYIRPDAGVLLNDFTGQHRSFVDNVWTENIKDYVGLIVCANKNAYTSASFNTYKGNRAIQINESLPDVRLSNVAYDKSCYGVISSGEDPESREDTYGSITIPVPKEKGDTRTFINSVGEGAIWVTNINGPLESGDYITTSNVVGYGQRQDDDILHNYTVAKITMDCDFNPQIQPVKQIKKEPGNVDYWLQYRTEIISEEEYNVLPDTQRRIGSDDIYYRLIYEREVTKDPLVYETDNRVWIHESREELVNSIDEKGIFIWEDHPTETEKAYEIRYLDADGNITDEANHVYKAAFVGCTYHCG